MLEKIISGGQTGVDRAALDIALRNGIAHGGWCPRGRKAEDGVIPACYRLTETPQASYAVRTDRNVRDADATLILTRGRPDGGTALTLQCAGEHDKPRYLADLGREPDPSDIARWVAHRDIRVLNIAGPRESRQPGIYAETCEVLQRLIDTLARETRCKK